MIDKLEFLLALARERHFTRAAEACNVTQPTLSAAIKQLEDTLGVLLVVRGVRFQGFTPEGLRVLDWARRVVGDVRGMRDEVQAMRRGELTGHLRIAVVPTALAVAAQLTTPFRRRHPGARFTILSRTSIEILGLLANLDIDAGITYLENEPVGKVRTVPLYAERYRLVVAADHPLGARSHVAWRDVASVPLCLLTPDMQNRRIIDALLAATGVERAPPSLESDSMIVLFSHIRDGNWAGIMPAAFIDLMGVADRVRAIPIIEPTASQLIGLIVPDREVQTPLSTALIAEAQRMASRRDRQILAGR